MKKIKNLIEKNKCYVLSGVTTGSLVVMNVANKAFATESLSTVIQSSLQTVVNDTLTTIAAIAPIGLTIFGATFCWKYAVKFFKNIAK